MFKASKAGQTPLRLEKRTLDEVIYEIDCSDLLLNTKHILFGAVEVILPADAPIVVTGARSKKGNILVFKVAGGPTNVPYSDYLVNFIVTRIDGSKLSVPISVRAYSV